MTSKFPRFVLAVAILLAISALAQTSSTPASGSPATVASSAPAPAATTPAAGSTGAALKVGTINIQDAIFLSNEGRKEMDALQKKYEPKSNELKGQNDELDALKKQLNTQQASLNEDALANLKKQIESKQKIFDRNYQDFQEEVGNAQQEVASKILQKMAPIVIKYSQDNGFGMIIDTSKPWPQSPVLWWNQDAVDITKAVVDTYNLQSGVPAPTPTAAKPPAAKPATGATSTAPKTTPKPAEPQKQ